MRCGSFMGGSFRVGIHVRVAPIQEVLTHRILGEVHDVDARTSIELVDGVSGSIIGEIVDEL